MATALIADDEPLLAADLRTRLATLWPELAVVALAHDGEAALRALAQHRPDVAFLDIRMPGATGIEVAQRARAVAARTRVVFVTAYDEYALRAFEAEAVDYLLKPVSDERLAATAERLRRALASAAPLPPLDELLDRLAERLSRPSYLRWIRASRRSGGEEVVEQIAVADIVYVQADDKYTCVYARDGAALREWLIRVPLTELARQLDPQDFLQIHRSVIVNLNAVAGTRRDLSGRLFVRLRDCPRELPVARQYAALFRQM
ncbi:MAG: LytTR family DNA-binding domain-containing protein [Burkholderiaceae bacterium]|nr:LytTR family DNA-binding domain-containing protein [Burkholderiaceae bacterium]